MKPLPINDLKKQLPQALQNCHLDHIAIAVKSLDQAMKTFSLLGVEFDSNSIEQVPDQGVRVAFGRIDLLGKIEFLEPLSVDSTDAGPIAKFLQTKGEGIHHVCFKVSNISQKQEELEQQGFRFIYKAAVGGAHNCLVNFLHPKYCHGVLVELSQDYS